MSIDEDRRLDELGERRIIEEILRPRYGQQGSPRFGDDCARVTVLASHSGAPIEILSTTDPCPVPMASLLGYRDLYYWGWLLSTINLSDLAAAGAKPVGLLTSLILPSETTVAQFCRLLDGIDDCCRLCGTYVIGGNLKEGSKIDLTGTALGVGHEGAVMSRYGCQERDRIVVIGDLGSFWAGVMAARNKISLTASEQERLLRNVLTPTPKVEIGQELARRRLLSACLDNSDGLYPSLVQLAFTNGVQVRVTMNEVMFPPEVVRVSAALGVEAIRFGLGWGDWQLVGCVPPSRVEELQEVGKRYAVPVHMIGEIRSGSGVMLDHGGRCAGMAPLDSQRFTKDSWFAAGLETYIDSLTRGPLWVTR